MSEDRLSKRKAKTKGTTKRAVKNNPVAKHATKFNRAAKHKDRKKAQKRGAIKYRRQLEE